MGKKLTQTMIKPFGIVVNGITPLYIAEKLPLYRLGYGQALIHQLSNKDAWNFYCLCEQLLNTETLTSKEKQALKLTMERTCYLKKYVIDKIEAKDFFEKLSE